MRKRKQDKDKAGLERTAMQRGYRSFSVCGVAFLHHCDSLIHNLGYIVTQRSFTYSLVIHFNFFLSLTEKAHFLKARHVF